ncbi:MAG: hypothetical protein H0T41_07445 [Rhodobacteraceae bacterium]|nr:hypothetical protein [Paracoccaceae bacterium]
MLNPDRLLPADPATRTLARALHDAVADLPIVSPHGHTDPRWWGASEAFADPAALFVTPDHYVTRMLVSQGVPFDTRALCSIPARHDVARRVDSGWLAEMVVTHRLDEDEAIEIAPLLAHDLAKAACKL